MQAATRQHASPSAAGSCRRRAKDGNERAANSDAEQSEELGNAQTCSHAHPIHGRKFVVLTARFEEAVWTVQRWIYMDLLGCYIWGWPRVGKSHLVKHLAGRITTRAGESIPVISVRCKGKGIQTDRKLWANFLRAIGLTVGRGEDAEDLYGRILAYLVDQALSNSESRVIVVLDEAQFLRPTWFEMYLALMNDLVDVGISPFFLSVGSNTLQEMVEQLGGPESAHLRGRFFNAQYAMKGLQSVDELRGVLQAYDEKLLTPETETPFTQHFLPRAYASGFRLSTYAADMWAEYLAVYKKFAPKTGWPMASVVVAVRSILCDMVDDRHPILTTPMLREAINWSGLMGPAE